jgi:exodeoxyribonuclease-3
MKIASWNVNSVKVRLPHLLAFLQDTQPDVLCLQEIKCMADDFPSLEIAALGYHVEALGQRAYNGVALVSREINAVLRVPVPAARFASVPFTGNS